jgi:hypothetical protein
MAFRKIVLPLEQSRGKSKWNERGGFERSNTLASDPIDLSFMAWCNSKAGPKTKPKVSSVTRGENAFWAISPAYELSFQVFL